MDAEKIILTKNFYELSPSEKEALKDYAQNETDFNEIKSFLIATKQTFDQQKLHVSDNLSQSILSHLHQPVEQKKTWFNALILFLFPEQKQFYQYPVFQIAFASLLILFIFNIIPDLDNDGQLAVNDEISTQEDKQKVNDEENLINEIPAEATKSENTIDNSNIVTDEVSSIEQTGKSENKYLETQEQESTLSNKPPLFDKNNSVESEDEITTISTNKPTIQSKETEELLEEDNDLLETDGVITEVVSNTNETVAKKKAEKKRNKNTTKAYTSTQDSQPSAQMESEKDISTQNISIQSTPNILQLFYISK